MKIKRMKMKKQALSLFYSSTAFKDVEDDNDLDIAQSDSLSDTFPHLSQRDVSQD